MNGGFLNIKVEKLQEYPIVQIITVKDGIIQSALLLQNNIRYIYIYIYIYIKKNQIYKYQRDSVRKKCHDTYNCLEMIPGKGEMWSCRNIPITHNK